MNSRYSHLPAAAVAVVALLACSSAPTKIHTLYPIAPAAVRDAYTGPPVRIDVVHMPPSLDRIEVVSNVTPGQLKINDLDHWSAPLGQVARQALSADMVTRLPQGRVIFPHLNKPEGALGIAVDVLDFGGDETGFHLQASWVTSTPGAKPATSGTAMLRTDASGTGPDAAAHALSSLLAQLADRIAAAL
jgi:uncharacterized protein